MPQYCVTVSNLKIASGGIPLLVLFEVCLGLFQQFWIGQQVNSSHGQ